MMIPGRIVYLAEASIDYFDESMQLGQKLEIGAQVAIMGILIVFAILLILWGVLELFRVFFYEIPKRRAAKKAAAAENPVSPDEPVQAEISAEQTDEAEDESAVLAAISAAVAVYIDRPQTAFRVVSFKKTNNKR